MNWLTDAFWADARAVERAGSDRGGGATVLGVLRGAKRVRHAEALAHLHDFTDAYHVVDEYDEVGLADDLG